MQGWRDHYCESEDRWLDCARYKVSLTGERVPISLLPNGVRAHHIERAADANRSGTAGPRQTTRQAPRQAPPPQPDPWSPETASYQPEPAPPEPPRPDPWSPETAAQFEPVPPAVHLVTPARPHHQASPPPRIPQPPDRRTRRARSSKRGWWARLGDWMKGPA